MWVTPVRRFGDGQTSCLKTIIIIRAENKQPRIARSTILMSSNVQPEYTIPSKVFAIHGDKGNKKKGRGQFKTL
jgi:hypothetical protein